MQDRNGNEDTESTTVLASDLLESLDTRPGATIAGRFRVETMLGRGGYGEVWRARQLRVDRLVALKLLRADVAHRDDAARRFEREARLASRLSHPNAVRVIDFGEDRGTLFLAMEYIDGPTLRERLRDRGPLPWREAAFVVMRIAAALRSAHAIGLVHRDLKPANVLLTRVDGEEQPVVIDFGLAKIFDDEESDEAITRAHAMLGTPAYMCPEVVRGAPVDGRSDLYSLGVVLFELLTGRVPLRGATPLETATMHLHVAPPPLAPLVPGAPAPLVELATALLAKSPDSRPDGADAVIATLRALLTASDAAPQPVAAPTRDVEDATMLPTRRPPPLVVKAPGPAAGPRGAGADVHPATSEPGGRDLDSADPTPVRTAGRAQAHEQNISAPLHSKAPGVGRRQAAFGALAAAVGLAVVVTLLLTRTPATEPPVAADSARPSALAAAAGAQASSGSTPQAVEPVDVPGSADSSGAGSGITLDETHPTTTATGGEPPHAGPLTTATSVGVPGEAAPSEPVPAPEASGSPAPGVVHAGSTRPPTEPSERRRSDPAPVGAVRVSADPAGRVQLGDRDPVDSPHTFQDVPVGRHQVRITNGDDVYTTFVEVVAGETARVRHEFRTDVAPVRGANDGAGE